MAKLLVPDELWSVIEPLLPPVPVGQEEIAKMGIPDLTRPRTDSQKPQWRCILAALFWLFDLEREETSRD